MIALPNELPFIRIGRASLAVCQSEWITKTITDAANGTDVPRWLAEDISRGVEHFLMNHYKGTVIDSEDFFERIDATLSNLGLQEVAQKIDKTPPPVRISLSELARRAGSGYELAFFRLLEKQFRSAAKGGVNQVECHGLKKCVRQLSSAKKWSRRCEQLQTEITTFLKQEKSYADAHCPGLKMHICH